MKFLQLLEHFNVCIDCFLYIMVVTDIKFRMAMIVVMTVMSVIAILAAMVVT